VVRTFCGTCGTPLWSDSPNLPFVAIRAGSLDDPSPAKPGLHIWTEAAQLWHATTPGAAVFERGPAG
jgi:hypothetical protein